MNYSSQGTRSGKHTASTTKNNQSNLSRECSGTKQCHRPPGLSSHRSSLLAKSLKKLHLSAISARKNHNDDQDTNASQKLTGSAGGLRQVKSFLANDITKP